MSQFRQGDKVSIQLSLDLVEELQRDHGGYVEGISRCIGVVGTVVDVGRITVAVEFGPGDRFNLNPAVLTEVMPFGVGDQVKIISDLKKAKELQRDHGGWVDAMEETLGFEGEVKRVFADGDLRVEVGGSSWTFNPLSLIPIKQLPRPPQPASPGDDKGFSTSYGGERGRSTSMHGIARAAPTIEELYIAIAAQNLENVQNLVNDGVDLKKFHNGTTALHIACLNSATEIVRFLLSKGMNHSSTDNEGKTPLQSCMECQPDRTCINLLIESGANPNDSGKTYKHPLIMAIDISCYDAVAELLRSGKCNPDVQDTYSGNHALHMVANMCDLNMLMILLDAGANPELANSKGFLPIHVGIANDKRKVVNYMLERRPSLVNIKISRGTSNLGMTPLHLAIQKSHIDIVSDLLASRFIDLEQRDEAFNLTPFLYAVSEKQFHLLDILFQAGCNFYATDKLNNNALRILFQLKCDDYNLKNLDMSSNLLKTYKDTEISTGFSNIKVAVCAFLIKLGVPFVPNNSTQNDPFLHSGFNPNCRTYCINQAPPEFPNCYLCSNKAEFKNNPCQHIVYCPTHAINNSKCAQPKCLQFVAAFVPLHPTAEIRRKLIQKPAGVYIVPEPAIIPGYYPSNQTEMPTSPLPKVSENVPIKNLNIPLDTTEAPMCPICYEEYGKVTQVLIDPCGHTLCDECSNSIKECHVCRKPILKTIIVYQN